jgi:GTP-binding protein HflX
MEPNSIGVSARTGEGIDELLQVIAALLPEPNVEIAALIPYDRGDLVSRLHLNSRIMVLDYREGGTFVRAMVKPEMAAELSEYRVVV